MMLAKPTREDRERERERRREVADTSELEIPKEIPARDSEYRRYVRSHPCSVRGLGKHLRCDKDIDAAHIGTNKRGIGQKASDYATVPLCRGMHLRQHAVGWRRFEEEFGIDRYEIAFWLLEHWMARRRKSS